jgi:hypothetical protein
MKLLSMYSHGYFVPYSACICTFSLLLALLSLYKAVGCWKTLLRITSSYPALLLLPVFTCFTFGSYKDGGDGLTLSWKWTAVNILISYFGANVRALLQLEVFEKTFYRSWILDPKSIPFWGVRFYYLIGTSCLTLLLTVLLFYSKLQYGVLLPSDPDSPHVLQDGAVVPLVAPQEHSLDLGKLRRLAGGTLVIALTFAIGNILNSSILASSGA